MYRRSKFVEILHEIRREMSAESDFDVDIFVEAARSGTRTIGAEDRKSILEPHRANDHDTSLEPQPLGRE